MYSISKCDWVYIQNWKKNDFTFHFLGKMERKKRKYLAMHCEKLYHRTISAIQRPIKNEIPTLLLSNYWKTVPWNMVN